MKKFMFVLVLIATLLTLTPLAVIAAPATPPITPSITPNGGCPAGQYVVHTNPSIVEIHQWDHWEYKLDVPAWAEVTKGHMAKDVWYAIGVWYEGSQTETIVALARITSCNFDGDLHIFIDARGNAKFWKPSGWQLWSLPPVR